MVDQGVSDLVIVELVRKRSDQGQDCDEAPVLGDLHIEDIDLQRVAGHCALDMDRTRDEMRARPLGQRLQGFQVVCAHELPIGGKGLDAAGREGM